MQHAHDRRLVAARAGDRKRALEDLLDLVRRIAASTDDGDAARHKHAQFGLRRIVVLGEWQHVYRLAEQARGLDVGVAAQRIVRGKLEVSGAAVVPPCRLEAHRKLGGDLTGPLTVRQFLALSDPALPFDAARLGDAA